MKTETILPARLDLQPPAETESTERRLPVAAQGRLPMTMPEPDLLENETRSPIRRLVIAGLTTILVAFGGFFGWAFSTELSSASVTSGTIIVDSKRKTVSHFEGGVLSRILVQEGDHVAPGQPLMQLEDTRARSDLQALESRRVGLIAKLARLRSERSGLQAVDFPDDLVAAGGSRRGCSHGGNRVLREAQRGQGGPDSDPAEDDRGIFGESEVSHSPVAGDRPAD